MTSPAGPSTPPPPSGPGRTDEADPLDAWFDRVAAAAPPLSDSAETLVKQLFSGRIESLRSAA